MNKSYSKQNGLFLKIINLYEIHKMMLFQLGPGTASVLGRPSGLRMTHGYC